MEIVIKRVSKYQEVTIEERGTKIDLGLFDEEEANELAEKLQEAAEALSS